ncbi:MAG TPA: peptidase M48, partial [Acidaminococcaceae bacterium]|nr:peptidase M48 [Acidaminococcaceae bacterium]
MMISGRSAEAGMISEKQELDMGKAAAEQIEAHYGVLNDPQINERVNRIGQSLVDVCGRKNIKYTFKVLNTEDVNALACPGGYIFVFKGLLDYMPSDAELAAVLGHEIGHVVKRHTVHQMEKNMLTQL